MRKYQVLDDLIWYVMEIDLQVVREAMIIRLFFIMVNNDKKNNAANYLGTATLIFLFSHHCALLTASGVIELRAIRSDPFFFFVKIDIMQKSENEERR